MHTKFYIVLHLFFVFARVESRIWSLLANPRVHIDIFYISRPSASTSEGDETANVEISLVGDLIWSRRCAGNK